MLLGRGIRLGLGLALVCALGQPILARSASAAVLQGDLDGNGSVDAADESLLAALWGSQLGDMNYDSAGDLDGDGEIGATDLALFGARFGQTGGDLDLTPPDLLVSLADIPDDMNDILVAPPDGFEVTLELDSGGHSLVDTSSLSVTSDLAIGPYPAGTELAPLFFTTPGWAVWQVPPGSDLPRTTHTLSVSVRDVAGNESVSAYPFAVRDFASGPPLGNTQEFFLDFGQDRSLGTELDFLEDLRQFGLSTDAPLPGAESLESEMRDRLVTEIVERVNVYYGLDPDGSAGPESVNIHFSDTQPGVAHSRLCVGGESSQGGSFLGAASMDFNNAQESFDECNIAAFYGVFPHAIDNLWGTSPEYQAVFHPLDPDEGGVPVGASPDDATVLAPGFDPDQGSALQNARLLLIEDAIDAFAQTVATAIAHEVGHMLGLTAPGSYPEGLWGGESGSVDEHNLTTTGYTPSENYLMNQGGSFSFDAITGRGGFGLPYFRALNWAFLRDQIVIDKLVYGLFPAPTLSHVDPPAITFSTGGQNRWVRFVGTGMLDSSFPEAPDVELLHTSLSFPHQVHDVSLVVGDPSCCAGCCMDGRINKFSVTTLLYDVRLINGDGQVVVLEAGLEVQ